MSITQKILALGRSGVESMKKLFSDTILQPISGEKVTGEDIRNNENIDSPYYKLRDMRSQARNKERQYMQDGNRQVLAISDWKNIKTNCLEILTSTSKDVEVLAWLIEACVRIDGFNGLTQSFNLARTLLEHFWDDIYPSPDEDGLSTRVISFSGLNGYDTPGTLILPINCIQLLCNEEEEPIALWHIQQANNLANISDEKERTDQLAAGAMLPDMVKQQASNLTQDYFLTLTKDIEESMLAVEQLYNFIKIKLGNNVGADNNCPQSNFIRESLKKCQEIISGFIHSKTAEDSVNTNNTVAVSNKKTNSREEVFEQLAQAANYFRKHEPLSPVAYLLEKTIYWGNLTLPELTKEIMTDDKLHYGYCHMIGAPIDNAASPLPSEHPKF